MYDSLQPCIILWVVCGCLSRDKFVCEGVWDPIETYVWEMLKVLFSCCLFHPVIQAQPYSVIKGRLLSLDIQISMYGLVGGLNRSELSSEGSFGTCSVGLCKLTICLARCLPFWYSPLMLLFFAVFQHIPYSSNTLSTVAFCHKVSFRQWRFLVNPHTFSVALSKWDFIFPQILPNPQPTTHHPPTPHPHPHPCRWECDQVIGSFFKQMGLQWAYRKTQRTPEISHPQNS